MISLDEIVNTIIVDLKLGTSEQIEFTNQFMQLFIFNLLLSIPEQYKDKIKELLEDKNLTGYKLISEKLKDMGISNDEAVEILDQSVKKSLAEVMRSYDDVLSSETKQILQKYI